MAKPCTAILIDPFTRTVTEVQWNGDYHHIYKLIDCETFDVARINSKGDGIFVDDEGLYREEQAFFVFNGYPQPLAGKGLLLGCDHEGESIQPATTLEQAQDKITFVVPIRTRDGSIQWARYA